MRRLVVLAVLAALLVAAVLHGAQAPTPAPFLEWQVATEYTQATTGKVVNGRVGLLWHRATGACWIVYPGGSGNAIAPAPKEVCGK